MGASSCFAVGVVTLLSTSVLSTILPHRTGITPSPAPRINAPKHLAQSPSPVPRRPRTAIYDSSPSSSSNPPNSPTSRFSSLSPRKEDTPSERQIRRQTQKTIHQESLRRAETKSDWHLAQILQLHGTQRNAEQQRQRAALEHSADKSGLAAAKDGGLTPNIRVKRPPGVGKVALSEVERQHVLGRNPYFEPQLKPGDSPRAGGGGERAGQGEQGEVSSEVARQVPFADKVRLQSTVGLHETHRMRSEKAGREMEAHADGYAKEQKKVGAHLRAIGRIDREAMSTFKLEDMKQ